MNEVDCFVAQVLGGYQISEGGRSPFSISPTDNKVYWFWPSWNPLDALRAAEQSREWSQDWTIHKRGDHAYEFECHCNGDDGRSSSGVYDSIPKAICSMFYAVRGRKMPEYRR